MEYKVIVDNEGKITTDVLNRGTHKCNDILQVTQSFGRTVDQKDKSDTTPVHDRISVRGN